MFSTSEYRIRAFKAIILLFLVVTFGTIGYYFIEGWPLLDGLYMTVITLATVGYGETHTLSKTGRLFTIILILFSLGIVGYAFSTLASFIIEGEFNQILKGRKMHKHITNLNDHFILCGGGPTGIAIANEFYKTKTSFVLVEKNIDRINPILKIGDIPYIQGDATEDEVLKMVGIDKAKGLITVLGEDKDNVFVVLTARSLNSNLRIVSRVINDSNIAKLKKAGADEIVSPNSIGGLRMASIMLRPAVVSFLDAMMRVPDKTVRVEEYHVNESSSFISKTLKEANIGHKTGLLIVAIKPHSGGYMFNPNAETKLENGDILIVVGTRDQLKLLS